MSSASEYSQERKSAPFGYACSLYDEACPAGQVLPCVQTDPAGSPAPAGAAG